MRNGVRLEGGVWIGKGHLIRVRPRPFSFNGFQGMYDRLESPAFYISSDLRTKLENVDGFRLKIMNRTKQTFDTRIRYLNELHDTESRVAWITIWGTVKSFLRRATEVLLRGRLATATALQWILLTASRWMDREEAWGVESGGGFSDQCTLIGQRINQSNPRGAVENNSERLKCFVRFRPMAWPCLLRVSQGELYLLQLQQCRILLMSTHNPYTLLHKCCHKRLQRLIWTMLPYSDLHQCIL